MNGQPIEQSKNALLITMEFWPFRGGIARYYKNFCDAWMEQSKPPLNLDSAAGTPVVAQSFCALKIGLTVYVVEGAPESRTGVRRPASGVPGEHTDEVLQSASQTSAQGCDVGYEVIRRKSYWNWMRPRWGKLLFDLFFWINQHRPRVVFVGHLLPIGVIVFLLQTIFHFDYIVFVHGFDAQCSRHGRWHRRLASKYILRGACSIVANSEYTKRSVREMFSVSEQNIIVLLPKSSFEREGRRSTDDVKQTAEGRLPVVLSVGRLVPRKGFDDVIDVAQHFVGRAKFIIFGKGPDEQRLRSLIHKNRLDTTCSVQTQDLSDEELSGLFDACDIFLFLPKELPGGDIEGFGQVTLEAQSRGKPVVVRMSGGAAEALIDGQTGFLVNDLETCRAKLDILISSVHVRKQMGERGRMFAREASERFQRQIRLMKSSLFDQSQTVSVIIPVGYNTTRMISTLKSLERQTYKNLEVIIVGDGISFDGLDFSSYRLRITSHKIAKSGSAAARNAGAKHATGDYLLFVDDDTVLREDCIEKMLRRLALRGVNSNVLSQISSFVYSGFRVGWKTFPAVSFDRATAYEYPYLDVTSMMRRNEFPGFDESLKRLQDWDLFLTILDRGGIGEPIDEILYYKSARLFKNLLKWKGISFWFPKFVWKLPVARLLYNKLPPVRRYHDALQRVQQKHRAI